MIHPFGGILPCPEDREEQSLQPSFSRRQALRWIATAAVAPWLAARVLHAAGPLDEKPANQHFLYYVVPKDGKKFSAAKKFGIISGRETGWTGREALAKTPGYWAWTDEAGASKIREDDAVQAVEQFTTEDITVSGAQTDHGAQFLTIQLAPNSWPGKAARGSYKMPGELAKQWTKDMSDPKMRIVPTGMFSVLVMSAGPLSDLALSKIKECPQVIALQWNRNRPGGGSGAPTTQAVGEEGGRPTTQAVGEEGAGPVRPPAGRVTTQAVGEEGR